MAPDAPNVDELAALYAAGALADDERAHFEALLNDPDSGATEALAELSGAVEALGAAESVAPPPELRDKVLASVEPDVLFQYGEDAEWVPLPFPGVTRRTLAIDTDRGIESFLLRLEPGAIIPAHPHPGVEECLVLEGDISTHGRTLRKGDYMRADAGSDHQESRTEEGCLLLITAAKA